MGARAPGKLLYKSLERFFIYIFGDRLCQSTLERPITRPDSTSTSPVLMFGLAQPLSSHTQYS